MRSRPFLAAGEQPRPFSEILSDRRLGDPIERVHDEIARLEAEARDNPDPDDSKRLQCEAEALRCAVAEQGGRPL